MSEEIISNLLIRILRHSKKYNISIQFWTDQWAVYIEKDGIELTSFGGDPEETLQMAINYLDRITPKRDK